MIQEHYLHDSYITQHLKDHESMLLDQHDGDHPRSCVRSAVRVLIHPRDAQGIDRCAGNDK